MSLISVIVPVYKVEQYLNRCVDSILAQTFTDFELILVDDGSPDNSPAICDDYANADSRVLVIHQENGGLSAARNAGIDWVFNNSDSKWITFIDSDDWVHPQYLDLLYSSASLENVDVSISRHILVNEFSSNFLEINKANFYTLFSSDDLYINEHVNTIIACGKLYRRDLFISIRYPAGKIHEDEYTTYKLLFPPKVVPVINFALYFYYNNLNGITKSNWNEHKLDAVDAMKEQLSYFTSNKIDKCVPVAVMQYVYAITTNLAGICKISKPSKELKDKKHHLLLELKHTIRSYRKHIPFSNNKFVYELAYPKTMRLYWLYQSVKQKLKVFKD